MFQSLWLADYVCETSDVLFFLAMHPASIIPSPLYSAISGRSQCDVYNSPIPLTAVIFRLHGLSPVLMSINLKIGESNGGCQQALAWRCVPSQTLFDVRVQSMNLYALLTFYEEWCW